MSFLLHESYKNDEMMYANPLIIFKSLNYLNVRVRDESVPDVLTVTYLRARY